MQVSVVQFRPWAPFRILCKILKDLENCRHFRFRLEPPPGLRARLATHLIPFDEMLSNDYQAFLNKRAAIVFDGMTKFCSTGGT
jgi:hypothetical protein